MSDYERKTGCATRIVEQYGFKVGDWLMSPRWSGPRKLVSVQHDGIVLAALVRGRLEQSPRQKNLTYQVEAFRSREDAVCADPIECPCCAAFPAGRYLKNGAYMLYCSCGLRVTKATRATCVETWNRRPAAESSLTESDSTDRRAGACGPERRSTPSSATEGAIRRGQSDQSGAVMTDRKDERVSDGRTSDAA